MLPKNSIVMEVTFEEALDRAGTGRYQIFHCLVMLATLSTSLLEIISYAFILPAAACDLGLPDSLRGVVTAIPNIGIILTAPLWGRLADSMGRKPTLLVSCCGAGGVGLAAAFMPDLVSFSVCKLIASLFLSCPSSLGFAYAGEMVSRKRRDLAVLLCNGFLTLSSALSPLLAWLVLSYETTHQVGPVIMKPWRQLTAVYAVPLLFTAIWLTQVKESPKFLMAKGRRQEALEVLRHVYVKNTGFNAETYGIKSIKTSSSVANWRPGDDHTEASALDLFRRPHLKWFALIGFLMFGLYTSLNGLFLFAADTINKVLKEPAHVSGTLCLLLNQPNNQTSSDSPACTDSISQNTFIIMAGSTVCYGLLVLLLSASPVRKRALLVGMYLLTGISCLMAGLITNRIFAGISMSALQLTALGIGPLTAYAVQLFPTTLRGTAVGAILMLGRVGSVVGATAAGSLLPVACTATFYGFSGLIFACALLCFVLPKS